MEHLKLAQLLIRVNSCLMARAQYI